MKHSLGNRRKRRFTTNGVTLTINGKSYRVFNINEYGVGFLIDSPQEIPIGKEIKPVIYYDHTPVEVTGIARHISQFQPEKDQLLFLPGWVCGTEFTTQHDLDGWDLFRAFLKKTES